MVSTARIERPPLYRGGSASTETMPAASPLPTWPLPPPSCYDADPMSTRSESGQTNLVAIVVLVGLVITGVWVWKRLSFDSQDYVIDQAIPMAFAGLVIAAGLFLLVRAFNRRRGQRRERAKLLAAFERATVQEKKLEIAFALIEVNGYRAKGLESVMPALRDLFTGELAAAVPRPNCQRAYVPERHTHWVVHRLHPPPLAPTPPSAPGPGRVAAQSPAASNPAAPVCCAAGRTTRRGRTPGPRSTARPGSPPARDEDSVFQSGTLRQLVEGVVLDAPPLVPDLPDGLGRIRPVPG